MPKDNIFVTRLLSILDSRNLSRAELAKNIGVTHQTVSNYTCGNSKPNMEKLTKIANYLHVSQDYLLGLTDVESTSPTMRSTCEYLNLSQSAVENMLSMKEGSGLELAVLDSILSSDMLTPLLQSVVSYLNVCQGPDDRMSLEDREECARFLGCDIDSVDHIIKRTSWKVVQDDLFDLLNSIIGHSNKRGSE